MTEDEKRQILQPQLTPLPPPPPPPGARGWRGFPVTVDFPADHEPKEASPSEPED